MGQLDLRRATLARVIQLLAEKHQRVAALLGVRSAHLFEPEAIAEEATSGGEVAHPDHRVQIAHGG